METGSRMKTEKYKRNGTLSKTGGMVVTKTMFEPLDTMFQKMAQGETPGPEVTMRYELLRLCTLLNFPKNNKPYIIRLAGAGFYFAAEGDEVLCYCCGIRRSSWVENDVPYEIHKRLSPRCSFLTRNVEVNVPVPKQDRQGEDKFAFIENPTEGNTSNVPVKTCEGRDRQKSAHGDAKQSNTSLNSVLSKDNLNNNEGTECKRMKLNMEDVNKDQPVKTEPTNDKPLYLTEPWEIDNENLSNPSHLPNSLVETINPSAIEHGGQKSQKSKITKSIYGFLKQVNLEKLYKAVMNFEEKTNTAYSLHTEMLKTQKDVWAAMDEELSRSLIYSKHENSISSIVVAVLLYAYTHGIEPLDAVQTIQLLPGHLQLNPTVRDCIVQIQPEELDTLNSNEWLSDTVVNGYMQLLERETNNGDKKHVFVIHSNTAEVWLTHGMSKDYLYENIKLSMFDHIFLPVNVNKNHWVLLVGSIKTKTVTIYDSLGRLADEHLKLFRLWRAFIGARAEVEPELTGSWQEVRDTSSRQLDNDSCGVFTLMNAECIAKDVHTNIIRQVHVPEIRRYIKQRLLDSMKTIKKTCEAPMCFMPERCDSMNPACNICRRWIHKLCEKRDIEVASAYICVICDARSS